MNVSSYLEAFLSVYGWAVYRTMFLLFMLTGLFLYPILRSMLTMLIDFLSSDRNDATGYLKQAGVVIALTIAVFFFAMTPIVKISFSKAVVKDICEARSETVELVNNSNKKSNAGKYFSITETKVPILPWIAMRLGQGLNSIFYTAMPCVMHTADANRAAMNVQTGDDELDKEFDDFMEQCHLKAVQVIRKIRNGDYDNVAPDDKSGKKNGEVKEWFSREAVKAANDKFVRFYDGALATKHNLDNLTTEEANELLEFVDSDFIYKYIYAADSPIRNNAPDIVRDALVPTLKSMRATRSVKGFSGYHNNGMPTCATWWNMGEGSTKGLRQRLLDKLTTNAVANAAGASANVAGCKSLASKLTINHAISTAIGAVLTPNKLMEDEAVCTENFRNAITSNESKVKGSKVDLAGRKVLLAYQGNRAHLQDNTISTSESIKATLATVGAMAAGFIQARFGIDLSGGLLNSVISFYGTVFVMKMMLKFLLPMAIMTVYMFWGIYMLIGEMRGTTIIKGMILIFSLTIIPGLWSVADHLDDKLWDAMYDSWIDRPLQMVLLDAASGIFYLAIPMIVFYLINLAGAGDHSGALADVQNNAKGLSGNISQAAGKSAGKGYSKSMNWLVRGNTNKEGKITSGGFAVKGWNGLVSGWKKWRGKK